MVVLIIVLFVRKRKEIFFWSIPALFIISNFLNMIPAVQLVMRGIDDNFDDFSFAHWPILLQVANSAFLLAHWVFSVQYLQTSLVLPKIFQSNHLKLQLEHFEHGLASPSGPQQLTETDNLAYHAIEIDPNIT